MRFTGYIYFGLKLTKYIRYLLKSSTKYGIHSPFVYDLVTKVINDKNNFLPYAKIESYRKELLHDHSVIYVHDLGAGSKSLHNSQRKISDIARNSLKRPKYSQLLFRLVHYFQPSTILELGTSLGITTLYLASGNPNAKVVTIEGSEEIAKLAQNIFKESGKNNIESVVGNFDEILLPICEKARNQKPETRNLNFVYFDGNHRKEPTLNYFNQCLSYTNNDSIFVFDDIHWSDEMEQAWEEIKKNTSVTTTVDLFEIGIVFFRKELSKEHFIIRF